VHPYSNIRKRFKFENQADIPDGGYPTESPPQTASAKTFDAILIKHPEWSKLHNSTPLPFFCSSLLLSNNFLVTGCYPLQKRMPAIPVAKQRDLRGQKCIVVASGWLAMVCYEWGNASYDVVK
jgi:hypothetical protein